MGGGGEKEGRKEDNSKTDLTDYCELCFVRHRLKYTKRLSNGKRISIHLCLKETDVVACLLSLRFSIFRVSSPRCSWSSARARTSEGSSRSWSIHTHKGKGGEWEIDWLRLFRFRGFFRRAAVVGDRLSPYVSLLCIFMAISCIFFRWARDNH